MPCHCGYTVRLGPIPCGGQPLECNQPCSRPHACDHPVTHNCHNEDKVSFCFFLFRFVFIGYFEWLTVFFFFSLSYLTFPQCPVCPFVVVKKCVGGHGVDIRVQCHVTNVSCGRPCGKLLPCGKHACPKTCHAGPCTEEASSHASSSSSSDPTCGHPCGDPLPACGHPCPDICHPGRACKDRMCNYLVTVYCPCRRLSKLVECGKGGVGARTGIQLESAVLRDFGAGFFFLLPFHIFHCNYFSHSFFF